MAREKSGQDKILYSDQKFINAPEYGGHAAISAWFIKVPRYSGKGFYVDSELSISDCNRTISLDVKIEDERELDRTRKKVKILKEFFQQLDEFVSNYEIPEEPEENAPVV